MAQKLIPIYEVLKTEVPLNFASELKEKENNTFQESNSSYWQMPVLEVLDMPS